MIVNWYKQKKRSFFIFLCCCLVFGFIAKDISIGSDSNVENIVYTVSFDFYGTDAKTMERLITIPMEELISSINGLQETQSVSDYGKAIITAYFHPKSNKKNVYLSFRDAVETLYEKLPGSVQKPRVYSSEVNQNTTIRIAILEDSVTKTRTYLEQEIKPILEGIKGVSEVKISGGRQEEILVEFDNEKLSSKGINPTSFASIIQEANYISSGTKLKGENQNLIFDTKIQKLDDIRILPVSADKVMQLSDYAIVKKNYREQDEYVRVNGKECVAIDVKTSFDGRAIFVSKKCLERIAKTELANCNYKILYDKGKEQKKLLLSVVFALLQGLSIILLIVPLFFFRTNVILLVGLLLPISILWSIAQIKLLGLNLDADILSGIGIAIGLVADTPFVIAEQNQNNLKQIFPSVIISCITTVLCIFPLCFLDSMNPGIKDISIAIILMLINSTIISMVFFPCFLNVKNSINLIEKYYLRPFYSSCKFFLKHQSFTIFIFIFISLLPVFIIPFSGNNLTVQDNPGELLTFYLEYESGITPEKIDKDCISFVEKISKINGVKFVLSNAQKGRCEFEIGYNQKNISHKQLIKELEKYNFPDAFLYIPNLDSSKNKKIYKIEVAVTGDDSEQCKKYAYEAIKLAAENKKIVQYVLNFKENEKIISVKPNKELLVKQNFSVSDFASSLRQIIFGPVVDKWIQDGKEMDIRTIGSNKKQIGLSDIENIVLSSSTGNFRVGSIANVELISGTGKLYRKDNRSASYFTLHIKANSVDKALTFTKKILKNIKLEKGYSFRFQRQIEQIKTKYNIFISVLILCTISIFLLLTALMENPVKALITTAVIFASISFPLIFNTIQFKPLETGHIVGLVIICGLSVNTAIYIEQSEKVNSITKVRDKIQSILLTNLSTILGCLPLLTVNNLFTSNLAKTLVMGTFGSFVVGTFLYPVVLEKINQK